LSDQRDAQVVECPGATRVVVELVKQFEGAPEARFCPLLVAYCRPKSALVVVDLG
jgi:hypothetical protein